MNNYIKALREFGWSEETILDDLENEVIPKTKDARNWTEWRSFLEKWTEDVNGWARKSESDENYKISQDELNECVASLVRERKDILPALIYIGKAFEDFQEEDLLINIDKLVLAYLNELQEFYQERNDNKSRKPTFFQVRISNDLLQFFKPINNMLTFHLDNAIDSILEQLIDNIDQYSDEKAKPEYFQYMANRYSKLVTDQNITS